MTRTERLLRRLVNPVSTSLTRAWTDSRLRRWALRHDVHWLIEMPATRRRRRG